VYWEDVVTDDIDDLRSEEEGGSPAGVTTIVEDISELCYHDSSPLYYDYDFTGGGGGGAITLIVIEGVGKYYRYW
jgi:hypothetical protein